MLTIGYLRNKADEHMSTHMTREVRHHDAAQRVEHSAGGLRLCVCRSETPWSAVFPVSTPGLVVFVGLFIAGGFPAPARLKRKRTARKLGGFGTRGVHHLGHAWQTVANTAG